MRIGFICPDGNRIRFEGCLEKCRMGKRCLSLPTLRHMSEVRSWTGKPSVTQCLNGTLEELLKITTPYYAEPQRFAFALLGTTHHSALEYTDMNNLAEERMDDEEVGGTPDLLEVSEGCEGFYDLYDYKTWGSYKVAKALGIKRVPVETGGEYKSGEKKGQKKTRKESVQSPDFIDIPETELQINRYRIMFERRGFPINRMVVQVTVRDGGIMAAKSRGVTETIYLIPVKLLPDEYVLEYYGRKSRALLDALDSGHCDDHCTAEENWDGRKCSSYCDVSFACPFSQGLLAEEG